MRLLSFMSLAIPILFTTGAAYPDCWEVTSRTGNINIASEIWQHKDGDKNMIECFVNDAYTKLDLKNVSSITLDKSDQTQKVAGEIILTSGTRGAFKINYMNSLNLISQFGKSSIQFHDIKSISRCGIRSGPPGQPHVATPTHDLVIMKNGDILSGQIITRTFNLKSSYADLDIGAPTIEIIDLEGGGQNVDVVQLRSGDRISGVLTNDVIQMRLPIGSEVTLQKDKIKTITFKQKK